MGRKTKNKKHEAHKRKAARKGRMTGFEPYLNLPDDVELFMPEDETYNLDILPYAVSDEGHPDGIDVGDTWYTRPFMRHNNVGVNRKKVICPRSVGKPCPICEDAERMNGNPDYDQDAVKRLWPSNRALYNVVNLDADEPVIQIFDAATFLFGQLLEKRVAQDLDERGDFFELENGCTIKCAFDKNVSERGTNYPCTSIDFAPREDYGKDILDDVVDLDDDLMIILDYDEIQALHMAVSSDEVEVIKEETETPPPRRGVGRRKKREEQEPEPEKEEQEPEPEKEDKPSRRRGGRRKKTEPEPEPEEDEKPEPDGEPEEITEDDVPDGYKLCVACDGRRMNTRGRPCRICNAEGFVEDPDTGNEPEPEKEEKPTRRRAGRRAGRK